jgi:putative membrane protein
VSDGPRIFFGADPRDVGDDPDYRFTLANERTFLAWLRTALALAAGGLGAIHLIPSAFGSELLGITLLALGFATAATAYRRWYRSEVAMRLSQPLPASRLPQFIAYAVALFAILAVVLFVVDELR